jgi:hypothetical protein
MPASVRVVFPPHLLCVDHLAAGMNYSHPLSRRRRRHRAVARVCEGREWGFCGSMGLGIEPVEEGGVASGRISAAQGSPEPAGDKEESRRTGRCCQGIEGEEMDLGLDLDLQDGSEEIVSRVLGPKLSLGFSAWRQRNLRSKISL